MVRGAWCGIGNFGKAARPYRSFSLGQDPKRPGQWAAAPLRRPGAKQAGEQRFPKSDPPMRAPKQRCRYSALPPPRLAAMGPTRGKVMAMVPMAEPVAKEIA